jgi:hypothetical protein
VLAVSAAGCSTLYRRQVYHPYKSSYKKPPEKKEATAELLPPAPDANAPAAPQVPLDPGAGPGAAAPAPGMLDAPPAIPGLPQ